MALLATPTRAGAALPAPPRANQTPAPAPAPPRRRRRWRAALIGVPLALLVLVAAVAGPILYQSLQASREVFVEPIERQRSSVIAALNTAGTPVLAAAPTQPPQQGWNGKDRLTILLLGVDIPIEGATRTDTIILVNIDPGTKQAAMLPIPRDTRVVIPGYGVDKINAAFALGEFNDGPGGGASLMMQTIEANFGIPIHHFAQIDFQGFVRMVDTIGGITVDVPYPIKDDTYPGENFSYQPIYFPAGWQQLDGARALQYARTRHADNDSRRSARQQQVLLAVRDRAIAADLLPKLPALIDDFGDSVRTDLAPDDALRLARLGTQIPRDEIASHSLLGALSEEHEPGEPYYLVPRWDDAAAILSAFTGTEVNPPGAALTDPAYDLPILIENGTGNDGLAGRVADVLLANGFSEVEVVMAADPGQHPATTVLDRGGNLGTTAVVTSLIGVGADQISVVDAPWSEGTAPAVASSPPSGDGTGVLPGGILPEEAPLSDAERARFAVIVTLGDDAPDPAGSELQLDEYQEQVEQREGSPVDPAPEPTTAAG